MSDLLACHEPVGEVLGATVKRLAVLAVAVGSLGGCDRSNGAAARTGGGDGLHAHPATEATVRTAVGQVRGIDAEAGTITVVLSEGRTRERSSRGSTQTLYATSAQQASVRVGEVVEFRSRAGKPHARLLTIDAHGHGRAREARGAAPPAGAASTADLRPPGPDRR